ncbi:MAG: glutamate--cysteine ligase [Gammaproteobacteria bacterium]
MGQEIDTPTFEAPHFDQFRSRLARETQLLAEWLREGKLSNQGPVGGFELEAWLVDDDFAPAPLNERFMRVMDDPLAGSELARFNVEFNNRPRPLVDHALREMARELEATWARGVKAGAACGARLLSIGILPTLQPRHLGMDALTPMNRYYALNEQVLRSRAHRPLRLDIRGHERLRRTHDSMMLEAAGTSFQIHLQAPPAQISRLYNAALAVAAPLLAAGANSPYLFGADLWSESRMPLFEQSLEVGGYGGARYGPLRRVSLGSGYVRSSIIECFEENLQHFPVLLPMLFETSLEQLSHVRLHNGTVWRWVRPLVGFDDDGAPHVRIEHRILPGSPSVADAVSDAALCYGLTAALSAKDVDLPARLPFERARDNLQRAARRGLDARIEWLDGARIGLRRLLLDELLPLAQRGLLAMELEPADCDHYLGIVRRRVQKNQNGANWQRAFVARHGRDMRALTAAYAEHQRGGSPVHTWPL